MQANMTGWRLALLGAAIAIGSTASLADAKAKPQNARHSASAGIVHASAGQPGLKRVRIGGHGRKDVYYGAASYASYGGGRLQCVPFARENSGIELSGNAYAWWSAADGVYERGSRPEVGSVLNFRANGRMRSGHVAVVTRVESARTVDIDHANWGGSRGGVTRNVTVVDVSPANDWSAVRVALGQSGDFGSVYPTYGFIYDRPDRGTMVANNAIAPLPVLANAPPRDLRPAFERIEAVAGDEPVEVAEATTRSSYRRGRHVAVHRAKATAGSAAAIRHVGGRKHTRF